MNKNTINILLMTGFFLPLILIFWPFAQWNDTMSLILRIISSVSVQYFVCRTTKKDFIRAVPLVFAAVAALWGIYLYCTSPSWSYATVGGLIADYISVFICCAMVYIIYKTKEKRKGNDK